MGKGRIKRWIGKFVVKSVVTSLLTGGKAPWSGYSNAVDTRKWDVIEPPINTTKGKKMETLRGWKTVLFSAAVIGLGALESTPVVDLVAQHPGPWTAGIGIVALVLRMITGTPVGQKF